MTKPANSEAHFSDTRSERILEPFWEDFGTILGGLGAPKLEKGRSKKDVKKDLQKSHAGVCEPIQEWGWGALTMISPGQTLEGRSARIEGSGLFFHPMDTPLVAWATVADVRW